jgi:crotonobetainyl-CoA:carnitine CoA-transferase CaiB-like acyl-CoA transferase
MTLRLPLGPVWDFEELRCDPQLLARGFLNLATGIPRLPVLWNGTAFPTGPTPTCGTERRPMSLPLQGCRVLDLGIITAGAATAALLADLGADVIKLESPDYRDPFRAWTPPARGTKDSAETTSPFFRFTNRGKRGISLDMKQPAGRAAFMRLVARSDVVVENFRRGVLDRLGIGFPALVAVNARIILASISSQGETGPMAQYVSFGSTLEAVGGLAALPGEADGTPVVSGRELNLPDQLIPIFAASMIVTAWLARRNGGGAVRLDLSQRELTNFMLGEYFAAAVVSRTGNAAPPYALQDCLKATDGWLAVSVLPEQTATLRQVTGGVQLADWCGRRDAATCVAELAAAGIAAAAALDGAGVLAARGRLWSQAIADHPRLGLLKGFPFQLDRSPMRVELDAPGIGVDTRAVLAQIGGYSEPEIEALLATGAAEDGTPPPS